MSEKTVEAHIARVYRKLGIRSRAELGARMAGNPASGQGRMEHPGFHAHLVLCDAALPGGSAVKRLPGLEPGPDV
jgi:hypothetical protein